LVAGHDESESLELASLEGTDDAPLVGSDALSEAGPEPDLDNVDPEAVRQVPADLAVAALALPACVANGRLYCLCAEPFDQAGLDALSKATGMEVVARPAPVGRVVQELRARYGGLDTETARAAMTSEAESPHPSLFAKLLQRRSA